MKNFFSDTNTDRHQIVRARLRVSLILRRDVKHVHTSQKTASIYMSTSESGEHRMMAAADIAKNWAITK